MDNNILNLFTQLMGKNTNNFQSNNTSQFNNPAFSSYPPEAYLKQEKPEETPSSSNFTSENLNNSNILSSLFSGQNQQNALPLLMSLLNKNNNFSSLSEIFANNKNSSPNSEKNNEINEKNNDDNIETSSSIDKEILL